MIIRMRWRRGRGSAPKVVEIPRRTGRQGEPYGQELVTSEELVQGFSAILWPVSTVPMALSLWRIGQDLGFTQEFFLRDGIASRWQVWFAVGLIMMAGAKRLSRWRAPEPKTKSGPSVLPAALEVAGQQADGHPRRRFGNLR